MAGKGTAAWLPGRPDEAPAPIRAPASGRAGASVQPSSRRATRPFRFGSEDRADPDPPLAIGALVGERYRIVRLLGEGGMGRVYEAEHTVLRRRVALKLLRREAQADPENLARFQREALAASKIGTPEIVEVVDFASHVGPGGRQTYMVMELLEGESLEAWMDRDGRLDAGLERLAAMCDGLAAAHRAGVIHRDIKPANVFCCRPDPTLGDARSIRVKILDFGIAKITAGGAGFVTRQGALLGTPYYLAPERALGAELSPAADLYSVGVILYEMLTGTVPFVADSFMGILAKHAHTQALDPRQAAPDRPIPDAAAALCMSLLAKDPGARPTAEALGRTLRELLASSRPELAALQTGPRGQQAGPGDDTQILDAGSSTSATLQPSVERSAVIEVASESRGRSSTAIGHASAASFASTQAVRDEPWAHPVTARAGARAGVIGLVAAVILAGLGVGVLAVSGLRGRSDSAPSDDATAATPSDVDPAVAPARDDPPESESAVAPASNDPPVPEPVASAIDPEPASAPEPDTKPKPKPKQAPEPAANDEPKPPPAQPEDPPPSPDPAAPDPESSLPPDPGLPTIKDDVYD